MRSSMRKTICLLLLFALLFTLALPALAAEYVYITAAKTVVRAEPKPAGRSMGSLKAGDSVEKTGVSGSYVQISYNGKTGYVLAADLLGHAKKDEAQAVKTTASVHVRTGPGTAHKSIAKLSKGKTVLFKSLDGDWAEVEYLSEPAYVFAEYLDLKGVATPVSGGPSRDTVLGEGDIQLELSIKKSVLQKGEKLTKDFATAKVSYVGSRSSVKVEHGELLFSIRNEQDFRFGGLSKLDLFETTMRRDTVALTEEMRFGYTMESIDKSIISIGSDGDIMLVPGQYTLIASFDYTVSAHKTGSQIIRVEIPFTVLAA